MATELTDFFEISIQKRTKRMKITDILLATTAVTGLASLTACGHEEGDARAWYAQWAAPGRQSQPWTFWYWMYGCVSDSGIEADLAAMKTAGIDGFYLMPIKSPADDRSGAVDKFCKTTGLPTSEQLSDEWWKRIATTTRVADSLGLQMGIHFSDGFALGGGPWITAEESMQKVVWRDTVIDIDTDEERSIELGVPVHEEDYYSDIAVFAYPARFTAEQVPRCDTEFPLKSKEPVSVTFRYDSVFTLRRVGIETGGNNYQAHRWTIEASADGETFIPVDTLTPARQGWQNTDAQATYAVRPSAGVAFRFTWTPEGSHPGSEEMDAAKWSPTLKVKAIHLGEEPVVDGYEGKSGLVWRISERRGRHAETDATPRSEIVRLSTSGEGLDRDSGLRVNLRRGKWHVLRMGHTSTGHRNATGGGGRGLECDKFSPQAINKQFDGWFGEIARHVGAEYVGEGKVLTRLHIDSWECGSQNWSETFAQEFRQRRGYELTEWLPLMAGVMIESEAQSDAVLHDVRQTIAELVHDIFYAEVRRLADERGLKISAECVCPTMVSDGMLHYNMVDYPMGEYWLGSPTHDKPNDMQDAISGAHIYGKKIIQAEGCTEVRGTWDETPASLKPLIDRSFCMGINSTVFHVNTHNPWMNRKPGMTLDGIGTFFQRDNTWWAEMGAFTAYIARCQALLQMGEPVVDLAVFAGDEVPRRALLPEKLVAVLPGLMGDSLVRREKERMANIGVPLEVSPVGVRHTANMTKADIFTNPLHGYKYDTFNPDILAGLRIDDDGAAMTGYGMKYRALITTTTSDARRMPQGARTITTPWTEPTLEKLGIRPDAILPEGVDFAHRQTEDADIYFIANLTDGRKTFPLNLRSRRAHTYLADAVTGRIELATCDITLEAYGSVFVVTTNDAAPQTLLADRDIATKRPADLALDLGPEWQIWFKENGAMLTQRNDTLQSWTENTDPRLRYYSGHAIYRTSIELTDTLSSAWIELPEVRDIATVIINDKVCGTAWTSPYRVDISEAICKGTNDIAIIVVNTWANALMGNDRGTPPYPGIWTNARYRREGEEPLPAGLIGTVRLEGWR